jgi:NAD(P)-dependent dehydrogenase (short-subunit alcohol dehydrogenase family)
MSGRLHGKVAVITGGTSGIGEATAARFVAEGARVVIAGRSQDKGVAMARALGPNALFQRTDVTREPEIAALIERALSEFGRIDCLFNNAGSGVQGSLEEITQAQFDHGMQLLLASALFGMKYVIPGMKRQGSGVIINNSSIAAIRTAQGSTLYSIAKAALTQLTIIAGTELGPHGVRVNSISPGSIATPIFWRGSRQAGELSEAENARQQAEKEAIIAAYSTPLSRSGLAKDIAAAAVYLASDDGAFVNCHDLVVDAGRTAMFNERRRA